MDLKIKKTKASAFVLDFHLIFLAAINHIVSIDGGKGNIF